MKITGKDWGLAAITLLLCAAVMGGLAFFIGQNSVLIAGYPAMWWCALLAMGVQWLAWIPASIGKTEVYYDFTGGLTYFIVVGFGLWAGSTASAPTAREWLLSLMVFIWAGRLATFLFRRVHRAGKDRRFDELKQNPIRFLVPWTMQGLWVFLTALVVITLNCQLQSTVAFTFFDVLGTVLWIAGFSIEVVADRQKSVFNSKEENRGKWIDEGLWSKAQHPNYFGEILLWTGIALFGFSTFDGMEYLALISPLFVVWLLTQISGVPLLRRTSMEKWGDNPEYLAYVKRTRLLIPL